MLSEVTGNLGMSDKIVCSKIVYLIILLLGLVLIERLSTEVLCVSAAPEICQLKNEL
jgi:hypothetical protein